MLAPLDIFKMQGETYVWKAAESFRGCKIEGGTIGGDCAG
jgi:hypothetical protein